MTAFACAPTRDPDPRRSRCRRADGTGIPVDDVMVGASDDFRASLGLDAFQTRRLAELGPLARLAAPLLRGVAKLGLRLAGKRARKA